MANNLSTYLQQKSLNWLKGTAFPSSPTNTYVALFTTQPANDGTGGTEVSGGGYARQAIATSGWSAISGATPSQISNANIVNFGTATANWGTIVAAGLYDASSSGNLLYVAALSVNKTVNNGDSFSFPVGNFVVQSD